MDKMLKKILDAEYEARERVEKAEKYRSEIDSSIDGLCQEIHENEMTKAKETVAKIQEGMERSLKEHTDENRKSFADTEAKIAEFYNEKGAEWAQKIALRAIRGESS